MRSRPREDRLGRACRRRRASAEDSGGVSVKTPAPGSNRCCTMTSASKKSDRSHQFKKAPHPMCGRASRRTGAPVTRPRPARPTAASFNLQESRRVAYSMF